jgi:NADH:ubiquinone reductase (H+-translocating)
LHLSGVVAWLLWCGVHIYLLIWFRSRVRVMAEWIWYYLTFKPGARIIYMRKRQIGEEEPTRRHTPRGLTRRNDVVPTEKIEKRAM